MHTKNTKGKRLMCENALIAILSKVELTVIASFLYCNFAEQWRVRGASLFFPFFFLVSLVFKKANTYPMKQVQTRTYMKSKTSFTSMDTHPKTDQALAWTAEQTDAQCTIPEAQLSSKCLCDSVAWEASG